MANKKESKALFSGSKDLDLGQHMAISQDAVPPIEDGESKYRPREPTNIDQWGDAICERCPLDECVKVGYGKRHEDARAGCPIDIARMKGWSIAMALRNSKALNLLSD